MAYNDHAVIAQWEDKWLDPDYDFFRERSLCEESEENEESCLTLDEYFELINKRNGENKNVKEIR